MSAVVPSRVPFSGEWIHPAEMLPDDEIAVLVVTAAGDVDVCFHEDGRWYLAPEVELGGEVVGWSDFPEYRNQKQNEHETC